MGRQKHLFKRVQRFTTLTSLFHSFVFCSAIFNITACTTDDDSGTTSPYNDVSELLEMASNTATPEFLYNYNLLHYFYIDQSKYLGAPQDYLGKASAQMLTGSSCPWDFFNIYYMYGLMNDRYTFYLDPSRSVIYLQQLINSKQSIDAGFTLDSTYIPDGKYVIDKVVKKSPADIAGIKKGDEIVAIEGVAPINEAVYKRLTNTTEGDTINYTVKRDSATLDFSLVIKPYQIPTVDLTFKDSIPVIKIREFVSKTSSDSGTYGEFISYLRETEKYKTTILDLRDNGGGDVDQCIATTQALLAKGDTVIIEAISIADTINKKQVIDSVFYINPADGIAKNRYFVILANANTASCSEVMIAGITTNKKSPIVGTTTYGKGIGQVTKMTPSISIASITAIRFLDKNRNSYHKYGFVPDYDISDNNLALAKAEELATNKSAVRTAGYGTENTGHFAKQGTKFDTIPGSYYLPDEYRTRF